MDRNLAVSYLIVDEMHHEHPPLVKDQYWDQVFPEDSSAYSSRLDLEVVLSSYSLQVNLN